MEIVSVQQITPRFEVFILGPLSVVRDGDALAAADVGSRKGRSLLERLLAARGSAVTSDTLVETLWPLNSPPADPERNLATLVSRLRAIFGPESILAGGSAYRWVGRSGIIVDLDRGHRLVEEAGARHRSGSPALARLAAEAALTLLGRGVALADTADALWVDPLRREAEQLHRRARRMAWRAAQGANDHEGAVAHAADALQTDPLDEDAVRALMLSHHRLGDVVSALSAYEEFRATLAAELGTDPSAETQATHVAVLRGDPIAEEYPKGQSPMSWEQPPPLINRKAEVQSAMDAVGRAGWGTGTALLLAGPAGIGKTRLALELLARARASGWTTVRGSAGEGGSRPYGPIFAALDRLLSMRPELLGALTEGERARLSRLSEGAVEPGAAAAEAQRQQFIAAVARLLVLSAGDSGLALFLDDAHDLEGSTIELLQNLVRAVRIERVSVILAFRNEAIPAGLADVRDKLLAAGEGTEIEVGPLTDDASAALAAQTIDAAPPAETMEALVRLAGGNPMFVEQLAKALPRDGEVGLPSSLTAMVEAQLTRLSRPTRSALERAATAESSFGAEEFAALTGVAYSEATRLLDEAVAAQVLAAAGDGYHFRHEVWREVLVRSLPAHRRAEIRAGAARQLSERGAAPALVARHLIAAGSHREAATWLCRAAVDARERAAFGDALELIESALDLGTSETRPAALELRADLLHLVGDARAPVVYAAAIAGATADRRRLLRIRQARAHLALGEVELAKEALHDLDAKSQEELLELLLVGGLLAWLSDNLDEARSASDRARQLALQLGRAHEASEALAISVMVSHSLGEWRIRSMPEVIRSYAAPELVAMAFDPHLCVADYLLSGHERPEDLVAQGREMVALTERSGSLRGRAFALTVLGESELVAQQLDAAEAHLLDAIRLHRRVGSVAGEALSLQKLAQLRLENKDPDGATTLLEEAREAARWSPLAPHILGRISAVLVRAKSDLLEALSTVEEANAGMRDRRWCLLCSVDFFAAASTVYARHGDVEQAREYLARAEDVCGPGARGPAGASLTEARAAIAAHG